MIRTGGFLGISLLFVGVTLPSRAVDLRSLTTDACHKDLRGVRGCVHSLRGGQRLFLCAGELPERAVNHRETQDSIRTTVSQELSAPSFLRSAWCRALGVFTILAVLAAFYRLRLLYAARESNIRLDERVNERMRLARDLHDTLLQSFQGSLLMLHAVTYRLPDHLQAKKELEKAIKLAQKAITEGRDTVQGLRSSTMATKDLVSAVTTLGEGLASDQNGGRPDFRVVAQGKSRDLAPLVRDEVYRIAGEALRNAFRHAGSPRIDVDIHYDRRQFQIRVRDFGKGIDRNVVNAGGRCGHYGLSGMQERAGLVGGRVAVWSEFNLGTDAVLTVPASIAYTKPRAAAPRSIFARSGAGERHENGPRLKPDTNDERPLDVPKPLVWS